LLFGNCAFGAASAEKRDQPVRQHEHPILEPGQPEEMDDEPEQPACS
jgi:hypothetical protein